MSATRPAVTNPTFAKDVARYIRRIRNDNKRRYADAYAEYLLAPWSFQAEPKALCSPMAAQTVRWEVIAIAQPLRPI